MTHAAVPVTWADIIRTLAGVWFRRHRRTLAILGLAVGASVVLLFAGTKGRGELFIGTVVMFAGFGISMMTMDGIVAEDYRSGLVALWFQKPGSLAQIYVTRYVVLQALTVLAVVAVSGVIVGAMHAAGARSTGTPVRTMISVSAMALLTGAIMFAYSAWNIRREIFATLVTVFGTIVLGAGFAQANGLLAVTIRTMAFPMDSIDAWMRGSPINPAYAGAGWMVLGHFLAWSAIAVVGLLVTTRRLDRSGNALG